MSDRYRKKPVVIDAVQITPGNDEAILRFMETTKCPFEVTGVYEMVIHTLEGLLHLSPGDWLIRGVQGEFYPCKPDIFEATYEPAGREPCARCGTSWTADTDACPTCQDAAEPTDA